jgi:hypothetical protein
VRAVVRREHIRFGGGKTLAAGHLFGCHAAEAVVRVAHRLALARLLAPGPHQRRIAGPVVWDRANGSINVLHNLDRAARPG